MSEEEAKAAKTIAEEEVFLDVEWEKSARIGLKQADLLAMYESQLALEEEMATNKFYDDPLFMTDGKFNLKLTGSNAEAQIETRKRYVFNLVRQTQILRDMAKNELDRINRNTAFWRQKIDDWHRMQRLRIDNGRVEMREKELILAVKQFEFDRDVAAATLSA